MFCVLHEFFLVTTGHARNMSAPKLEALQPLTLDDGEHDGSFPTCQVRVVRFYVSCLLLLLLLSSSPLLVSSPPAPCRTSTTTIHAQCALPDLNHDHPRPVFPAGPQPRVSPPSVPCRTSTTTIPAQCSLPDLNREYPRQVFPAGPQPGTFPAQCAPLDLNLGPSQLSVQRWTSTAR